MQHFLDIADFSSADLWRFLHKAKQLKTELKSGGNKPVLQGKILGMVFQKPSLRTRISFEVGMMQLGGQATYIAPTDIGLGNREAVADVARVLSRYVDGIMARVFSHDHVLELAEYSQVPVINGLSDYNHPCQALADVFTIWEKFDDVVGKRLAYVGDGNNVAVSLIKIAAKLGLNINIATPSQYQLSKDVLAQAQDMAEETEIDINITHDPVEAVTEADIIYTDVWTSMGQETEVAERLKVFPPYQVNSQLIAQAKPKVIVMHCLPAHRGDEITNEVIDGDHSVVFDQAENRLHAQKGILAELL